ncbi:hypothetical protein BC567DRAFT_238111 [Phyllosticta citribraziliensis]
MHEESFLGLATRPGNLGKRPCARHDGDEAMDQDPQLLQSVEQGRLRVFSPFSIGRQSNVYDKPTVGALRRRVNRKFREQLGVVEQFATVSEAQKDDKRASASGFNAVALPRRMVWSIKPMIGATWSDDGKEEQREDKESEEHELSSFDATANTSAQDAFHQALT